MKQYTNEIQTAKLIELGFEKPKSEVKAEQAGDYAWYNPAYSIGELIEMLPPHITHGDRGFISYLSIAPYVQGWKVTYTHIYIMLDSELVDALYHTIVKLKEEVKKKYAYKVNPELYEELRDAIIKEVMGDLGIEEENNPR
jgi:hypothetical protein